MPEPEQHALMLFGGQGTRLIYVNNPGNNFATRETEGCEIHIIPLELAADDRAVLSKAYAPK